MSKEPTSKEFDPLLALYSESSNSASDVKVFDNVAVFEANLKRIDQKKNKNEKLTTSRKSKSFSQRKRIEAEVQSRDLSKLKEMMEQRRKMDEEGGEEPKEKVASSNSKKQKHRSNIFTIMEKLSVGPLSLLHRITKDHLQCNVYTRHFGGLRGVLVGYIVAFDRYMNIAMVDVDETFAMSPRGQVIEHQKKLTAFQLTEALKEIQKNGLGNTSQSAPSKKDSCSDIDHLSATGAVIVRKLTSVARPGRSEASSPDVVKRYNWQNPPKEKAQTFSGGKPQLYHRHINNLYVRGDSVVLISLPT